MKKRKVKTGNAKSGKIGNTVFFQTNVNVKVNINVKVSVNVNEHVHVM